ncbi:MAG TPA: hypothetical protein VJT82_11835 [Pyrinomonadaceae bacterium]|nr:hypothetical protein [Pyrinomonadaceae bacterium]
MIWKSLCLCLLLASLSTSLAQTTRGQTPAASAQPPATPATGAPGVAVLKFGWSKERLGWERDPFSGPVENFDEMRVRSRNEKRIDDAKRGGSTSDVDRIRREAKADSAILERRREQSPPRYGFMYKVTIKNTGAKAIKTLDWDHVFFDPDTKTETGRHQFTGDGKVSPGKQKEFAVFIAAPPSRTISVHKLNKNERDTVGEQIVIMRVEYADGSVWQRP